MEFLDEKERDLFDKYDPESVFGMAKTKKKKKKKSNANISPLDTGFLIDDTSLVKYETHVSSFDVLNKLRLEEQGGEDNDEHGEEAEVPYQPPLSKKERRKKKKEMEELDRVIQEVVQHDIEEEIKQTKEQEK